MTWGEFKKLCEDGGVTDDLDISYIDLSSAYGDPAITIDRIGNHVSIEN